MAWPERPWRLPVRLEAAFGADPEDAETWRWRDISSDVDPDSPLQLTRGRQDEAGDAQPASVSPRLVNNSGDYTPGNPSGAHYPHVRQGTPGRLSMQAGDVHLRVPDITPTYASTGPLSVTTDLDVRVEVALDRLPAQTDRTGAAAGLAYMAHQWQTVMGQWTSADNQRSWILVVNATGGISLRWSPDGVAIMQGQIPEAVPYVSGQRLALRAVLDVDNGSGGWTVRGYYAPSLDGPWTLLGAADGSGVTSVYAAQTPTYLGDIPLISFPRAAGRYYRAEIRNGVDGPILASPDFTGARPGDTQVTDAQGNVWTLEGSAEITNWRTRMVGTADEWAPTWPYGDLSHGDYPGEARVDVALSGILRRMGQGAPALESTLRRRIPSDPSILAYWPFEDGPTATQAYSPIPGVAPMQVSGDVQFASDDTLPGSSALPSWHEDAQADGRVPRGPSGAWHVEMVYRLDQMPTDLQTLLVVRTTGTARYVVRVQTNNVRVFSISDDSSGNEVTTQRISVTAPQFTGSWNRLRLFAQTSGSNIFLRVGWVAIGENGFIADAEFPGTVGRIRTLSVLGVPGTMHAGHVAAFAASDVRIFNYADHGFTGERALDRMRRLAEEERLPISVLGYGPETPAMGPQRPGTLLDLLRECEAADGGILSERREAPGLQYRPRYLLYNQTPRLILDARQNEIAAPFSPILDDQRLRNDITVSREGGSSAVAADDQSIAEHGRYTDDVTLNVANDTDLQAQAGWRLHLGTWPGMRYPEAGTALEVAPETINAWLDIAEGDRIQVTNLPPQHPPGTVDLMVQGLNETISPTQWSIRANASPGGPWTVGQIPDTGTSAPDAPVRADTAGSELYTELSATATTGFLFTTDGPVWVTSAGPDGGTAAPDDLPFDIQVGGEVARVGAIEPAVWDDFDRTEANTWGQTTDTFATWVEGGGPATDRAVTPGVATLTLSAPTTTARWQILPVSLADCEIVTRISTSQTATGGSLVWHVIARFVDTSTYYAARVHFTTAGNVYTSVTRSGTEIDTNADSGFDYQPGDAFSVRVRVDGDRVRVRVWPEEEPEPSRWSIDRTITTDPIPSGYIGLMALGFDGNTNVNPVLSTHEFQVVNPQWMRLDRSINGVSKAHPAGTAISLAHPIVVAL